MPLNYNSVLNIDPPLYEWYFKETYTIKSLCLFFQRMNVMLRIKIRLLALTFNENR